jgi:hypothetical protein
MTSHRIMERRGLGGGAGLAGGFGISVTVQNNSPKKVNGLATDLHGLTRIKKRNLGVAGYTASPVAGLRHQVDSKAGGDCLVLRKSTFFKLLEEI